MGKLSYNVYSNINDETFLSICEDLILIETRMRKILSSDGWRLHSPVANSDALIIDFIKTNSEFSGNIGLKFDDIPRRITFTLYVTKSSDENGFGYFYRKYVFENEEFSFFEDKIEEFTESALGIYNNCTKMEIIGLGEKSKL